MVSDVVHLDTTISQRIKHHAEEEKDDEDAVSVSTTSTDNCDGGALVLQDAEDKAPCFQNIEVTNSSDVHFGNKTYYQGPVTIKQVLYTNRDGEKSPGTNDFPPQLTTINEKCAEDNINYANYNSGYTTDGAHHISSNGHAKLPNGIHNHFDPIGGRGDKKLSKNQWIIIGVAITIVVLLIATALVLVFTLKSSDSADSPILGDTDDPESGYEQTLPPGLRFINRTEWGAAPPKGEYTTLQTPVPYVIIHHTATSKCLTLSKCKHWAIEIQKFHMESNGWDDIGYNFMVGGDGYAYEARGWTNLGAHAKGYNTFSIGIAFIGTFTNYLPTKYQLEEAKELIAEGVRKGYIKEDYKLLGMNQVSTFESPGKKLIKEIKTWPHFAVKP